MGRILFLVSAIIPSPDSYRKRLIIRRSKALLSERDGKHTFLNGDNTTISSKSFGLNSKKLAPHIDELNTFEEDLLKTVENNQFLSTLANNA